MKYMTWADMTLGTWLIVSPVIIGYSAIRPVVVATDILPGLFLIATSAWILAMHFVPLRVTWLQAVSGLWLIIGSFVLMFSHLSHAATNALIVGILVLVVNLIVS